MEKSDAKSLKLVKIRPILCPCISGTKCDRHKLIFSAERGGQSNRVAPYNRDQIGSTITKTGVITDNKLLLVVPKSKQVTYIDRAFSIAAPRLWNALPNYIKLSVNIEVFKCPTFKPVTLQ